MVRLHLIVPSCFAALLCLIISSNSSFADAQGASTAPAPASSYSFGDVLALSALGGRVPSFTPLSIWNWLRELQHRLASALHAYARRQCAAARAAGMDEGY